MKAYGKLTLRGDVWHIDAAPHVHMRAKRIFGKLRDQSRGVLMLSHTPELCADLQWFMGRYPLEMDAPTARTLAANAARHRDRIARLEDLLDTRYDPPTFALAKPARSYQAREAALLLEAGGLLVGDDVGLGKTVTGICVLSDPRALPAVVVCQTHLTRQWRAKMQEFAPELKVHIIKRRNPYELPTHMGAGPDVVICSYGMVTGGWSKVLARYAKFVIFDEVQELRHMGTQRYGAALDLCEALPYRMGLSATPIYNYGAEIFSVLDLLRPGCLGTFEEFHTEWCGKNDILKDPKAFGTWARDNFLIVRHTRAEVGRELPPVTRITQTVQSDTKELDKVKNTAVQLARTILANAPQSRGAVGSASRELTVLLRQYTGIAKAPHVADFVRMLLEQGESVVLCGWHREVYAIWLEKLAEFNPVMYTGTESPTQKAAAAAAFVSGESKLFIISLRSGAGLDGLQVASECIVFGELDYSPGVHEQCIGRIARDGQDNHVMAYFLVSEEGSDPPIIEIVGLKREQKEGIMNPTIDFIERVDDGGDHVRRLAASYLKQIGVRVPVTKGATA